MRDPHRMARTTPEARSAIASSPEPSRVLAERYGVSTETVRKWRKRGLDDPFDRSTRPHRLRWKASEEERAAVCALRRSTNLPLDSLARLVAEHRPHLNRTMVWRILRAEGLSRRERPPSRGPVPAGLDGPRGEAVAGVAPAARTDGGPPRG